MGARFAESTVLSIPDSIVRDIYHAHHGKIQVAMIGTQLLGVRLCRLLMLAPALTLAYAVALADGWVQRAIRRASGGRESASLYHRAKRWGLAAVALLVFGSLLIPVAIDPGELVVPAGLVVIVLARLQWTYYKKHL